jgi:geranylgeranyl pyrophosphate synthase
MSDRGSRASALVFDHFSARHLGGVLGGVDRRALDSVRAATEGALAEWIGRPGKELRARFVERAFALASEAMGRAGATIPEDVPSVVELLHAGSLIVDDVEDDAVVRRGGPALHRVVGVPAAINAGNLLYFVALDRLASVAAPEAVRLAMLDRALRGLVRCHHGQALDLTCRASAIQRRDVAALVDLSTTLKTGALIELGCRLGAIAAAASADVEESIAVFGRNVGVGLQMLDDASGLLHAARAHKAVEDVVADRPTWAWAWLAERVSDDTYASLASDLRMSVDDRAARDRVLTALADAARQSRDLPRTRLDEALSDLRRELGDVPTLDTLVRDLLALEKAYGS